MITSPRGGSVYEQTHFQRTSFRENLSGWNLNEIKGIKNEKSVVLYASKQIKVEWFKTPS